MTDKPDRWHPHKQHSKFTPSISNDQYEASYGQATGRSVGSIKARASDQNRGETLGGKDLIVRMLAEVFQVNQRHSGQARWQRVSSSLIPVSLYSRTTSKWLNYLLAASSMASNDPVSSTMSPDSRDFLLYLLHQFHQQRSASSTSSQGNIIDGQDLIVFQVVGHDSMDGYCRKVLNVKLCQPGTRLGHASDYFVYWKDSPAFPSSTGGQQVNQNQFSCCLNETQTWGLNFASTNDAKLFYDICSLNLIDLNFNADHLRHLAPFRHKSRALDPRVLPPEGQANSILAKQHHQHQNNFYQSEAAKVNSIKRQISSLKCPTCKQIAEGNRQIVDWNRYKPQEYDQCKSQLHSKPESGGSCPIHSNRVQSTRIRDRHLPSSSLRMRSKSTSRRPKSASRDISHEQQSRRMRSLSTPASPNNSPNNHIDDELMLPNNRLDDHQHHPLCSSIANKQELMQIKRSTETDSLVGANRIQKPARGIFRDASCGQMITNIRSSPRQVNSGLSSLKSSKETANFSAQIPSRGSQYTSRISKNSTESSDTWNNGTDSKTQTKQGHKSGPKISDVDCKVQGISSNVLKEQQDEQVSQRFHSSRASQRRSTGVDMSSYNEENLRGLSHKDARSARARYANSRNMKDFLSLDAGATSQTTVTTNKCLVNVDKFHQDSKLSDAIQEGSSLESRDPQRECKGQNGKTLISETINAHATIPAQLEGQSTGADLKSHNVATTTEDLPLDQATRLRMFKLTSEEIISERTEPRSLSNASVSDQQQNQNDNIKDGRRSSHESYQTRAVSLRPDVGHLSSRSGASRRRSLERSLCIDLDCSTQMNTSVGHNYTHPNQILIGVEPRARGSFKSAPDVSVLGCCSGLATSQQLETLEPSSRPTAPVEPMSSGWRTGHLSCYAIPLCCEPHRDLDGRERQWHSCPNSLRRNVNPKITAPPIEEPKIQRSVGPQGSCLGSICRCHLHTKRPVGPTIRQCGFAIGGMASEPIACGCYNEATTCGALAWNQWQHRQHQHQHQVEFPHRQRIDQSAVIYSNPRGHNQTNEPISRCHCGLTSCGPEERTIPTIATDRWPLKSTVECQHSTGSLRPCSSLSSKSPLQYGLYESEQEDDWVPGLGTDLEEGVARCPGRGQTRTSVNRSEELDSRIIAGHLNPVQGYDQTMARSSARSRQRARSQPAKDPSIVDQKPSNASDHRNQKQDTYPLSKSMENVQKLIREVQYDLDDLEKYPSATRLLLQSLPATQAKAAISNARQVKVTPLGDSSSATLDCATGRSASRQMSREQSDADKSRRQHQLGWSTTDIKPTSATRRAGQYKCVGAIRKAGFLSVKKWILKRRQSIELARKQGWKRYWVCLRGTVLLFHSVIESDQLEEIQQLDLNQHQVTNLLSWIRSNSSGQLDLMTNLLRSETNPNEADNGAAHEKFLHSISKCYIEKEPKHLIIIDGAIAQPIPEHPRRDFVFCLSTTFGDAYLFQATCQLESDNWISAIHNACAASLARELTRDEAVKLFNTKLRHLELAAEKKIFLRQRLESRLTSMASMSHITPLKPTDTLEDQVESLGEQQQEAGHRTTMRSLLTKLSQQLLTLDLYIEQIHCEIYQLRCYLSSCGSQQIFYRNQSISNPSSLQSIDLPHPKSLLMHVSRPTKVLLIKMGVFTVSSFHAYTHARQESLGDILCKIKQKLPESQMPDDQIIQLRVRSQSLSKPVYTQQSNNKLESDTEELIQASDLRLVSVHLSKKLYDQIKLLNHTSDPESIECDLVSDDRYSIQLDKGDKIIVNLKLHSDSDSDSIIRMLLSVIRSTKKTKIDPRNYCLKFYTEDIDSQNTIDKPQYIIKRKETLGDWNNCNQLELSEKMIFKVELNRARIDEESEPFGISIEAQLTEGELDNQLSVFCNYIEWGSVADKAGLRDDDELLMINGVPVKDLDMMFVECLLQDGSGLQLIVRSARSDLPKGATLLDRFSWRPTDDDGSSSGDALTRLKDKPDAGFASQTAGSQLISDEYISSLVCPPPPSHSKAFLRTDVNLLRQKSDIVTTKIQTTHLNLDTPSLGSNSGINRSRSDHNLSLAQLHDRQPEEDERHSNISTGIDTNVLPKREIDSDNDSTITRSTENPKDNSTSIERLKKSILELLETEYAYIKHLETIVDHYMNPLKESSFLKISQLESLSSSVMNLLSSQREFFNLLVRSILNGCKIEQQKSGDDFDGLNTIVHELDTYKGCQPFEPILDAISKSFLEQTDRFKQYITYCVGFSKLQKLIHPKQNTRILSSHSSTISSMPSALNTFQMTNGQLIGDTQVTGATGNHLHRTDFLKPLGSIMTVSGEQATQLKLLGEFLSNLDSSSSSASLSLLMSSSSDQSKQSTQNLHPKTATSNTSAQTTFQMNVHQQNFESYLIKPIQRIVKYPMLLNSIVVSASHTELVDSNIFRELHRALTQMESVASHVNEAQCLHDQYGGIFQAIEHQYLEQQAEVSTKSGMTSPLVGSYQPPICLDVEHLLFFDSVEWLNRSEFTSKIKKGMHLTQILFVFDSCVVFICMETLKSSKRRLPILGTAGNQNLQSISSISMKHKVAQIDTNQVIRYQCLIPVREVQVRSAPNTEANPNCHKWELFQCSSSNSNSNLLTKPNKRSKSGGKVFLLASPNNESRVTFLRKIRLIIRESVRNMSLPLARSPSTKSLTSKKLSSPSSGANTNSSCSQSTSLSPDYKGQANRQIKDKVECEYTGRIQNSFKAGIQVIN